MNNFFHGWRRKTGVVTLFLACVFMAGWVRSGTVEDSIISNIYSRNGAIECVTYESSTTLLLPKDDENANAFPPIESGEVPQNMPLAVVPFTQPTAIIETIPWSVPYWTIVIPLTLLSAWLLLRKPRPPNPKQANEPIAVEGL